MGRAYSKTKTINEISNSPNKYRNQTQNRVSNKTLRHNMPQIICYI